jgi:hypothetical protein
MWPNATGRGCSDVSAISVFLHIDAEFSVAAPAIFRGIVNDDVQVLRFAGGVLDHGVGDCFHKITLLVNGSAFPHFNDDERHDFSPLLSSD